ncbi:MAG TPA: ABC transporter permease, partial [Candidatus Faecivivens stercoravium]|nr:ABC transporter permease [Candidatus Faecivivens stercoravium]
MKVKNGKVIRKLTLRKIAAERSRSIVAALAIGLTALLFTSLFTILLSVNDGFQQSNFRQAGGYSHGSFKSLTAEEVDILKNASGIARYGVRQYAGQLGGEYKNRIYTEVDYVDASDAEMMYSTPTTGSLPAEGTDEAAADSQFLAVIGVEPELGARFTVPVEVNGVTLEETFTLSGWWEAEPGSNFSFLFVPQSRAAELLEKAGGAGADRYENAGKWSLDVMLAHPADIAGEMEKILESRGYQGDDPSAEGYISYGVNWGYTQAQVTSGDTLGILGAGAAGAIFIALTGYLIIYNVFQIAVGEDIRFYGLLKTIGATRRQLGRMVRLQALVLCCAGLPAGLLIGWVIGYLIAPTVTRELVSAEAASANPVIFLFAAVFAILTVLISCRRPARLAGSVSPVEAVRYTEGAAYTRKKGRKAKKNGRFF